MGSYSWVGREITSPYSNIADFIPNLARKQVCQQWRDSPQKWCLLVEMDSSKIHSSHQHGRSLTKKGTTGWVNLTMASGKRLRVTWLILTTGWLHSSQESPAGPCHRTNTRTGPSL